MAEDPPEKPEDEPQQQDLPLAPAPEEEAEPVGGFEAYEPFGGDEGGDEPRFAYTTSEFHNVIQKQVIGAAYEMMVESKLPWHAVSPFLRAARDLFRGDFERTGRVGIHGVQAEGDAWIEAEEAYLSLSVADQDDGREWLSETWWLSDLVLAEEDPARVREAARALERTVAKLDSWLSQNEAKSAEADAKGPDDA
jgi:hypothetical protein